MIVYAQEGPETIFSLYIRLIFITEIQKNIKLKEQPPGNRGNLIFRITKVLDSSVFCSVRKSQHIQRNRGESHSMEEIKEIVFERELMADELDKD